MKKGLKARASIRAYDLTYKYKVGERIHHLILGKGTVERIVSDKKMFVRFAGRSCELTQNLKLI